jgi:hypothetical protein
LRTRVLARLPQPMFPVPAGRPSGIRFAVLPSGKKTPCKSFVSTIVLGTASRCDRTSIQMSWEAIVYYALSPSVGCEHPMCLEAALQASHCNGTARARGRLPWRRNLQGSQPRVGGLPRRKQFDPQIAATYGLVERRAVSLGLLGFGVSALRRRGRRQPVRDRQVADLLNPGGRQPARGHPTQWGRGALPRRETLPRRGPAQPWVLRANVPRLNYGLSRRSRHRPWATGTAADGTAFLHNRCNFIFPGRDRSKGQGQCRSWVRSTPSTRA